jgi:hypothetical protein
VSIRGAHHALASCNERQNGSHDTRQSGSDAAICSWRFIGTLSNTRVTYGHNRIVRVAAAWPSTDRGPFNQSCRELRVCVSTNVFVQGGIVSKVRAYLTGSATSSERAP